MGLRPTFADLIEPLIEVHIFNFDMDIYGEIIEVNFGKKIRDEAKFSSIEELKAQIQRDLNSLS